MSTEQYSTTVIFEPAEEGGFVATVPALPGCVTQGETLDEARAMASEAILGYIESSKKDGLLIPCELAEPVAEKVTVTVGAA